MVSLILSFSAKTVSEVFGDINQKDSLRVRSSLSVIFEPIDNSPATDHLKYDHL
jgi:hypothetical protein